MESENTKKFLTKGEWIEDKNTIEKIRVTFSPENTVVYNLQNKDSLSFNLTYWAKESVFLESWESSEHEFCVFEFQENGKDTLSVNFKYNDEDYKTQMIRKVGSH